MSVVTPPLFTAMDDQEFGLNRPVSEESVRKLVQNVNLLGSLAIIGTVRAVSVNTPGVPLPTTDQFQLCDGSEITDVNSPLKSTLGHTRLTPKLNDKYMRGASSTTVNNDSGDMTPGTTLTRNISHTHDIGFINAPKVGDSGSHVKGYASGQHDHSVGSDLSATDPIDLAHIQTTYYLKIK